MSKYAIRPPWLTSVGWPGSVVERRRDSRLTGDESRCRTQVQPLHEAQVRLLSDAYTGIPMTFGSYLDKWWTASPERKDIKKSYTKDNICFVCFEFNTADRSARCVDPDKITGNGAWSKEKVQIFRDNFVKPSGDLTNIKDRMTSLTISKY